MIYLIKIISGSKTKFIKKGRNLQIFPQTQNSTNKALKLIDSEELTIFSTSKKSKVRRKTNSNGIENKISEKIPIISSGDDDDDDYDRDSTIKQSGMHFLGQHNVKDYLFI